MTAFVGNVVWACIADIAIALVVAAVVGGVVRVQRPSAATRCALWFVALAVCAVAPLVIVGTMLVRGIDRPAHVAASAVQPSPGDASGDKQDVRATGPGDASAPRTADARAALHALSGATQRLRRPPSLSRRIAVGIVAVWALGALAGLVGLGRSLLRVRALKARSSPLEGTLADDLPWLTETAGREIYLRLSYEIETPIAVGFRRPVILIPSGMAADGGLAAIESLVMHEYAHLARYDDWTNLAQRCIERVVWFNPLVWYFGRRIALEREVAADEAVVARTNDAKDYAATLWRMAREMRMPEHVVVAPGAMLTRRQISIRIERLLEDSRARRPQAVVALAVIAIGACTVAAVAATAPPIVLAPFVPQPGVVAAAAPAAEPPPVAAAPPAAAAAPVATPRVATPPAPHAGFADPISPELRARIEEQAARTAATVQQTLGLAPHALPAGDLTRDIVAGCRTCDFSGRDLSGLDLSGLAFYGARFDGANLSNVDFSGARLIGVSMRNAKLSGANFAAARITGSQFEGTDFAGADFTEARFVGSTLEAGALHANGALRAMAGGCAGCNFSNADLHGQDLHGVRLDGANLDGADLHGANLRGSRLTGVNLNNADLDHVDLRDADLTGANLSGASMDGTLTANAVLTGAVLP